MKLFRKGQGATEYLLMLAAVLVIVAIAVWYVTSAGGYPAVGVTATDNGSHIRLDVVSGSIPAGDWQYQLQKNTLTGATWTGGDVELKAPYVVLGGPYTAGDNYHVALRHRPTGHIYIADQTLTI